MTLVTLRMSLSLKELGFMEPDEDQTSSPTIWEVLEWLRKEKGLYVYSEPILTTPDNRYYHVITRLKDKKEIWETTNYDSPGEALLAGIKRSIKILKDKQKEGT